LAAGCRAIWDKQATLLSADPAATDTATEQQLRADLLELVLLWNRLEQRIEPPDSAARQTAKAALAEAERIFGPHLTLGLAQANGNAQDVARLEPRTAWEHVAIGRHWLAAGRLSDAAVHFEQAVNLEPQSFWPNFYLAICNYRNEDFDQALNGFSACVALAPRRAECYYNRALAHAAVGNLERAIQDDRRALELDATLATAALHRATLYCRLRQYDQAEGDLRLARSAGADPASVNYTEAVLHLARGDKSAALSCAKRALSHQPNHAEAHSLEQRLRGER
jgi:tetratricopeptide (TPR) repeat protein